MTHHSDAYCAADYSPYCPWYCYVHNKHHPVITMVTDCEEKATRE